MRRVLITGGTGFVGTHLIRHLQPTAPSIAVLASDSPSRPEAGVEYYDVDICREDDVRSVVREIGPTEIYHLAGVSAVGLSWTKPRLTLEVNLVGTQNLLEAAMSLVSPPRILNVSTAQVYARSDKPLTEESPLGPDNPYAASKAMAEMLEVSFRNASAGGIITARSFNHTGPGQLPTFVLPSIAKQFAEIEIGIRSPKLMVGNIDVKRDFTDVRDVVRAYAALIEKGRTGQIYNVSSGVGTLLSDIIGHFQAICRTEVVVETDPTRLRPREVQQVVGDSSKIRKEIGWSPQIPMAQTIGDMMDYWRKKVKVSGTVAI